MELWRRVRIGNERRRILDWQTGRAVRFVTRERVGGERPSRIAEHARGDAPLSPDLLLPSTDQRLELVRVLLVLALDPLVRAEEGVLGHIGRVSARRRSAAERLRDAADVVGARPAADAEVVDADLTCLPCEVR